MIKSLFQRAFTILMAGSLASMSFADVVRDTWYVVSSDSSSYHVARTASHDFVSQALAPSLDIAFRDRDNRIAAVDIVKQFEQVLQHQFTPQTQTLLAHFISTDLTKKSLPLAVDSLRYLGRGVLKLIMFDRLLKAHPTIKFGDWQSRYSSDAAEIMSHSAKNVFDSYEHYGGASRINTVTQIRFAAPFLGALAKERQFSTVLRFLGPFIERISVRIQSDTSLSLTTGVGRQQKALLGDGALDVILIDLLSEPPFLTVASSVWHNSFFSLNNNRVLARSAKRSFAPVPVYFIHAATFWEARLADAYLGKNTVELGLQAGREFVLKYLEPEIATALKTLRDSTAATKLPLGMRLSDSDPPGPAKTSREFPHGEGGAA